MILTQTTATVTTPAGPKPRGLLPLLLLVALLAVAVLSIGVGARSIAPMEVVRLLVHPDGSADSAILTDQRLPRTLLGLVVGAALALSGALLQSLTRNPLAEPGFLGINAGSGLAVVAGMTLGVRDYGGYVWLALLGAGLATLLIFAVGSRGSGSSRPVTLALTGVAVAAMLTALTSALVLRDQQILEVAQRWQTGSLAGRGGTVLLTTLPFVVVGTVLAAVAIRGLDRLSLGEDVAQSLGVHVGRTRALAMVASTLLAGAATAAAGPVVFVGLVAPHLARRLTGLHSVWVLPVSAALGATMLLAADVVGRVVARPGEVQVAIMTALIGAPFFIAVVRRMRPVTA